MTRLNRRNFIVASAAAAALPGLASRANALDIAELNKPSELARWSWAISPPR